MGRGVCVWRGVVTEKMEQVFALKAHLSLERINIETVEICRVLFSVELAHETLSTCSQFDGCCCAPLDGSLYHRCLHAFDITSLLSDDSPISCPF